MALRLGLPLRDMEMVQFHPTGLLAGPDTRMTGTVLEEGLRGAGGHLLDGAQRALHGRLRPASSSAPRAISSRAPSTRRCAPAAPRPTAASTSRWATSGPTTCASSSRAWWSAAPTAASTWPAAWSRWCRRRTISWAGWSAAVDTSTELPGLFVAGEDAGGVHGANRLGGNGVANSTVFGGIAGETMAAWVGGQSRASRAGRGRARRRDGARAAAVCRARAATSTACARACSTPCGTMSASSATRPGCSRGLDKLDAIEAELLSAGVADGDRAFNLTWHDWLNLRSLVEVSKVIAAAALKRENSPRRALPRGLSRRRRPRHLDLHRGAPAGRAARHRGRAGRSSPSCSPGESLLKDRKAAE